MTETPGQESTTPLSAAQALTEVMRRVEGISKTHQNKEGGGFFFRGIDDVMNTVGPIMRDLGLLIIPKLVDVVSEQVEYGGKRTLGFRTRVRVQYTLIGPDGSTLVIGPTPGEAIDSGDKGTTKAMSVAFRSMFLQTLVVPTNEPDPDESTYAVAKPEATVSNPLIMAKLQGRINEADTDPKLQAAYKAVMAEADGEKGNITIEDRDALVGQIREAKAVFDAAAARGTQGTLA